MFKTKQLAFSAMALALATVLSTVLKLPSLPFGGSITLFSMLVVCMIGYWYGPTIGLVSGVAYGLLQFLTASSAPVHPIQVLLDYFLAFGALGLSGFFANSKHGLLKGYLVGVTGRFIFSTISGFVFYTTYTAVLSENLAALWGSFTYNLIYMVPEVIVTVILLCLPPVTKMLARVKTMATAP
jgi:thiamine transporter